VRRLSVAIAAQTCSVHVEAPACSRSCADMVARRGGGLQCCTLGPQRACGAPLPRAVTCSAPSVPQGVRLRLLAAPSRLRTSLPVASSAARRAGKRPFAGVPFASRRTPRAWIRSARRPRPLCPSSTCGLLSGRRGGVCRWTRECFMLAVLSRSRSRPHDRSHRACAPAGPSALARRTGGPSFGARANLACEDRESQ
jgi:hypothetical protein